MQLQKALNILCTYQWYAPPGIPGADGERRGICRRNLPQGVGTNTHICLSHTVHNREIWVICKSYVGGWYAGLCPRYGGCCSIMTYQFPFYLPLSPKYYRQGILISAYRNSNTVTSSLLYSACTRNLSQQQPIIRLFIHLVFCLCSSRHVYLLSSFEFRNWELHCYMHGVCELTLHIYTYIIIPL